MEPVLKGGGDPKVPAPALEPPEQVRVLLRVDLEERPVGGDDIDREEVVARQPVPAHEPPQSPTEGEAGDPGGADRAARGGQAELLGLPVELGPGRPGLGPHGTSARIDPDALHGGQIDDDAALAHREAGDAVAP